MMPNPILRGDIWEVRFDPSEGDEIKKVRPAVVMTVGGAGRMKLHIVAPVTGWQSTFKGYFWMVLLNPTSANGLTKESAADAFQIKSLSTSRFQKKIGVITDEELQRIAKAVALCIGYKG